MNYVNFVECMCFEEILICMEFIYIYIVYPNWLKEQREIKTKLKLNRTNETDI